MISPCVWCWYFKNHQVSADIARSLSLSFWHPFKTGIFANQDTIFAVFMRISVHCKFICILQHDVSIRNHRFEIFILKSQKHASVLQQQLWDFQLRNLPQCPRPKGQHLMLTRPTTSFRPPHLICFMLWGVQSCLSLYCRWISCDAMRIVLR